MRVDTAHSKRLVFLKYIFANEEDEATTWAFRLKILS
jgi:hypothetical protein